MGKLNNKSLLLVGDLPKLDSLQYSDGRIPVIVQNFYNKEIVCCSLAAIADIERAILERLLTLNDNLLAADENCQVLEVFTDARKDTLTFLIDASEGVSWKLNEEEETPWERSLRLPPQYMSIEDIQRELAAEFFSRLLPSAFAPAPFAERAFLRLVSQDDPSAQAQGDSSTK